MGRAKAISFCLIIVFGTVAVLFIGVMTISGLVRQIRTSGSFVYRQIFHQEGN